MKPLTTSPSTNVSQPLLDARFTSRGTTRIVTVAGEMDVSSVLQVGNLIDRALRERPETLLLDLAGLTFCDSSGIHLVLRTHQRSKGGRTRFLVIPPQGPARRVFDICRVEDCVTFVVDEDASAA